MRELSRAPDMLTEVHLPENPLSPAFEQREAQAERAFSLLFLRKIVQNLLGNPVLEMLIAGKVNPTCTRCLELGGETACRVNLDLGVDFRVEGFRMQSPAPRPAHGTFWHSPRLLERGQCSCLSLRQPVRFQNKDTKEKEEGDSYLLKHMCQKHCSRWQTILIITF